MFFQIQLPGVAPPPACARVSTLCVALFLFFLGTVDMQGQRTDEAATGEQHTVDSSTLGVFLSDVTIGFQDAGRIGTSPLRADACDVLWTAGIFASTGVVMTQDEALRTHLEGRATGLADGLLSAGGFYGNAFTGIAIGAALYAGGFGFDAQEVRVTGRMLVEAIAIAGVITSVVKSVAGRSRPFLEEGAWMFRPGQMDNARLSFPSGHATVAWAMSSVLASRIDHPVASVALYTLAAATCLQRIDRDQHWASDVLLGSAIGFSVGRAIVRMHESRTAEQASANTWEVYPLLGASRNGLAFTVRF